MRQTKRRLLAAQLKTIAMMALALVAVVVELHLAPHVFQQQVAPIHRRFVAAFLAVLGVPLILPQLAGWLYIKLYEKSRLSDWMRLCWPAFPATYIASNGALIVGGGQLGFGMACMFAGVLVLLLHNWYLRELIRTSEVGTTSRNTKI